MTIERTTNREFFSIYQVDENDTTFVKAFPSIHEKNMDSLDIIIGDLGPHEYLPVLSVSDDSTVNLGTTGTIEGVWFKFLDMVYVWGRFAFGGADVNPGNDAGYYLVSLPVPLSNNLPVSGTAGADTCIGSFTIRDNSTTSNRQTGVVGTPNLNQIWLLTEDGVSGSRVIRPETPFTWAAGDVCNWHARYKGAGL